MSNYLISLTDNKLHSEIRDEWVKTQSPDDDVVTFTQLLPSMQSFTSKFDLTIIYNPQSKLIVEGLLETLLISHQDASYLLGSNTNLRCSIGVGIYPEDFAKLLPLDQHVLFQRPDQLLPAVHNLEN